MERMTPALVMQALKDSARDVRTSALRLSERWLAQGDAAMQQAVLACLSDSDWAVRRQLAATIGEIKGDRAPLVARLLEANGDDPIVVDAALSGIAGSEGAVLAMVAAAPAESPQRTSALTVLAATLVRGKDDTAIQQLFAQIADPARPDWQRAALMTGTEAAVAGAALPGSGRGRAGNAAATAPCPTCPGGRSGPGGASAFPSAARSARRLRPAPLPPDEAGVVPALR